METRVALADLPARVSGVLAVLFLVFNEGYLATGPDTDPVRHDLTGEAIRLARLIRGLLPEDGEVAGLLALMLLTDARRRARFSPGRYQILAAISAVHISARDIRDTDWSQIVALYHQLVRLDPSPIVALNRGHRDGRA
jgi:RNA polymerase sigma-70 factor, ECF subfamily